jgi:hypothetical protein
MKYFKPERDGRASLLAFIAVTPLRAQCDATAAATTPSTANGGASTAIGESPWRWGFLKKRLGFCQVVQDGDDEGSLHLDRLPAPHEAA